MSVTQHNMLEQFDDRALWRRLNSFDWLWALLVLAGAVYTYMHYADLMDGYEVAILAGTAPVLIGLGWAWKPMRPLSLAVAGLSLAAIGLYGASLGTAESNFFLKYLISSQSAIMWMSALYVLATATYFFALATRSEFTGKVAAAMTWSATTMGLVGLMVRWRESYLISPDVGHIPVSNLYEVFILFSIITALLYLYYEGRYRTRALGGFVLLVISAAVGFLLWYTFDRGAHEIQPLVPALKSYWMKIHVPANFVGYGAFALAAMVGVAYLIRHRQDQRSGSQVIESRLPALDILDDVMYKSIALGFAFFTVATILGALWAAEAWGGYWSWDPKETWALIVWLNYAAWLHMRLTKGWRGTPMAWWAIVGLFVTLFAFLGVNMFLSGLHSYGEL
ncbi:MAG TPA: c-type cytochrome biogenesis protein CcsB [Gammaproteobacteria bacterium]|nr:c-type cytochrome biogenesis protein CcsB [Gammaproteobacteria bacterium]